MRYETSDISEEAPELAATVAPIALALGIGVFSGLLISFDILWIYRE
ncbi:hypothetical protein AYI68_g6065, partial [Smittium mucronatum]